MSLSPNVGTWVAALLFLASGTCAIRVDAYPYLDDVEDTMFAALLSQGGSNNARRRLLHDGVCELEDTFLYDTDIELVTYGGGGSEDCTEKELQEIGTIISDSHQDVLHIDPRLHDVVELLANLCEKPEATVAAGAGRKLSTLKNWGGTGSCRWCPPGPSNCDHGCRMRRLLKEIKAREGEEEQELQERNLQTITDGITSLELWNTASENAPQHIGQVKDGEEIDVDNIGSKLSIEAVVVGNVESVDWYIDGSFYRRDIMAPYFLSGDRYGDHSYIFTTHVIGNLGPHTIKAMPFSSADSALTPITITFTLVETVDSSGSTTAPTSVPTGAPTAQPTHSSTTATITNGISSLSLWKTSQESNPQKVGLLENGDKIDIDVTGNKLTVEAEVSGNVGRVEWSIDGSFHNSDGKAPFFLSGDRSGEVESDDEWDDDARVYTTYGIASVGSHTIEAKPYSLLGSALPPITLTFTIFEGSDITATSAPVTAPVVSEVTGFKLWDTTDESHAQFLNHIQTGDVVDLKDYGNRLTIEAEVSGDVARVDFAFDAQLNYKSEYGAPFVLSGDYVYAFLATSWPLAEVGSHTVTATPFMSDKTELPSSTLTFEVVDTSTSSSPDIGGTTQRPTQAPVATGIVTGFLLWNTTDESNPEFLKKIQHTEVIDIKYYGSKLSIEAEYTGDIGKVNFDLDNLQNYGEETSAPFLLGGKEGNTYFSTDLLAEVGTHTITATPYSKSGIELTPITFSILCVDGSTNLADMAVPGSRQELINLLEDDMGFYFSGIINHKYFYQSGHCLQHRLVWVKVHLMELNEANQQNATCTPPTSNSTDVMMTNTSIGGSGVVVDVTPLPTTPKPTFAPTTAMPTPLPTTPKPTFAPTTAMPTPLPATPKPTVRPGSDDIEDRFDDRKLAGLRNMKKVRIYNGKY